MTDFAAIPVGAEVGFGERITTSSWLAPAITAAIVLPVAVAAIDGLPVGAVHDDAMYVILAKALATGQGYHWINLPGAPAATHYPPGFPALLSLVWRLSPDFPANIVAFKLLNALLLAVAAGALTFFARRRLGFSPRAAIGLVIAGAIAVPTLVLSTIVMSEMLFLALLIPALLFAERVIDRGAESDSAARDAVLLGLAGATLMYVRSHGIAFVAGAALVLALYRSWKQLALFALSALIALAPWQLWVATHRNVVPEPMRGDYESYGSWLALGTQQNGVALLGRTLASTSRELFAMFVGLSTAGLPTIPIRLVVSLAAIAAFVFGIWRLRHRAPVTALFLAAYLAIVSVWPFAPSRFVWGIWPLVFVVTAFGVSAVVQPFHRSTVPPFHRAIPIALALLMAAGYATYNWRGYRGAWWSSIPRQTAAVAVPSVVWVAAHSRPADVIESNAEGMMYLYAGRLAVPATRFSVTDYLDLPSERSRAGALRSILGSYRIDAVAIIANDSLEAAGRAMAAAVPPALSLRDSVPHGLIFTPAVR